MHEVFQRRRAVPGPGRERAPGHGPVPGGAEDPQQGPTQRREAPAQGLQEQEAGRSWGLLVVVDQSATIGALAVAAPQDMGTTAYYLPQRSMRRIADLTPGSTKTDTKYAAVITHAHRHILILHAMIRNDILYDPIHQHSRPQPLDTPQQLPCNFRFYTLTCGNFWFRPLVRGSGRPS